MTAVSSDLLRNFDGSGKSYTSYPTPDRFVEACASENHVRALQQRRKGTALMGLPLSLYVHIPFCQSLCHFCACNKIITKNPEQAQLYLRHLGREIDLYVALLGTSQVVSQLHLGGGTPTFFTDDELRALMGMLRRGFTLAAGGDYSIEVDPRTVDPKRVAALADMGFNGLSLGVQDFDAAVQKAVHRIQETDQVFALVEAARRSRFDAVSIDLIYGLPLQTPESFERTLVQVKALRPDRIALYAYVHFPERFKPQRRIVRAELPSAIAMTTMLSRARAVFDEAGYVYVGMDQFALPDDALAVAKRQGRLHRNFQGYSTHPDCDLVGLGLSAISRVGPIHSQNASTLDDYYDHLNQGRLPVVRGLALSRDDLLRRTVIMALMCQGQVQFEPVELAYLIDFRAYFASELEVIRELARQRLVVVTDSDIQVTPSGWFVVDAVAMVFDRYLQADRNRERFSRII